MLVGVGFVAFYKNPSDQTQFLIEKLGSSATSDRFLLQKLFSQFAIWKNVGSILSDPNQSDIMVCFNFRVSEFQSFRVSEFRVSEFQISELQFQSFRVSEFQFQGFRVSEFQISLQRFKFETGNSETLKLWYITLKLWTLKLWALDSNGTALPFLFSTLWHLGLCHKVRHTLA